MILYQFVIGQLSLTKTLLILPFYNFTASVSVAVSETMPTVKHKSSSFAYWFSKPFMYYIKKKNCFFFKEIKTLIRITITVLFVLVS
jgi:hypothetical protein